MTLRPAAALLLALAALSAQAQTYKWVDAKGQVNYSNAPPPQVAGKATQIEDRVSVMGMDPAVRAWAERRFADQARADEADWQRRQQAMAQQAYYTQPMGGYNDSYYDRYGYAYPWYGVAAVRRPLLASAIVNNRFPQVSHHAHGTGSRGGGHGGSYRSR